MLKYADLINTRHGPTIYKQNVYVDLQHIITKLYNTFINANNTENTYIFRENRPCSGKLPYIKGLKPPKIMEFRMTSATSRSFFLAIYMNADYPWLQFLSI